VYGDDRFDNIFHGGSMESHVNEFSAFIVAMILLLPEIYFALDCILSREKRARIMRLLERFGNMLVPKIR